ncbi:MAG: hypothetical protein KF745_09960 [Phycisphaeraceae bacterium]|nr:hypothetical protein [Phycisphaeraceae bacterium]
MPTTPQGFAQRLAMLRADIAQQGRRVQTLIEAAFDAVFAKDAEAADQILQADNIIDRVDVAIEQASVDLLKDATAAGAALPPDQLRMVLTIVKVNNELERIADLGLRIAKQIRTLQSSAAAVPQAFRVLANSVVGILRDVITSLDRGDKKLARVALASEDAVEAFKRTVLREVSSQVATGQVSVDLAVALQEIATCAEAMADHSTNIAEQVIYVTSGAIVRHMDGRWEDVPTQD